MPTKILLLLDLGGSHVAAHSRSIIIMPQNKIAALLLTVISSTQACDTEGDIRLMNGSNKFEGRVEYCNDSQWKSVCYYGFYDEEASVACRQLGFSGNLNRKLFVHQCIFALNLQSLI